MENLSGDTTNNQENMKEKVRVVRLDDTTISKPNLDMGSNSDGSVWSLCDINNDDSHVDLGDITPSISPVFTEEQVLELSEQQMVDPMAHRLLDDNDHVFSVHGDIPPSVGSGQQKAGLLRGLRSDLDMFDQEMQNMGDLHRVHRGHGSGASALKDMDLRGSKYGGKTSAKRNANETEKDLQSKASKDGEAGDLSNTLSLKEPSAAARRCSPRKQAGTHEENSTTSSDSLSKVLRSHKSKVDEKQGLKNTSSETTTALAGAGSDSPDTESKGEHEKPKKDPSRRSSRIARHAVKEGEKIDNIAEQSSTDVARIEKKPLPLVDGNDLKEKRETVQKSDIYPDSDKTGNEISLQKDIPQKSRDHVPEDCCQNKNSAAVTAKSSNEILKSVRKEMTDQSEEDGKKQPLAVTAPQNVNPSSPEKRVTRSLTGNLKPKQTFDKIQEKLEAEQAKRLKKKTEEAEKLKTKEINKNPKDGHAEKKVNSKVKSGLNASDSQNSDSDDDNTKLSELQKKQKNSVGKEAGGRETKVKKTVKSSSELSSGLDISTSSESEEDNEEELDCHADDSDYSPEDDPDRLWCVCRKPHGNRFMICCDGCEEWFHGKCVGITMEQGRQMEKNGKEYVCDKCKEKRLKALIQEEKAKAKAKANENSETAKTSLKPQREAAKPTKQVQEPEKEPSAPPPSVKPAGALPAPPEPEEKKRKQKEPGGFRIPKKVRTTPTPVSHVQPSPRPKCIVEGCNRPALHGVYCGRPCIERHVSQAVRMLASKGPGGKPQTSEGNRVAMIEKSSGRVIAGMAAPVMTHLTEWIMKNPSFQVLVSVTSPTNHPAPSFYKKAEPENKVKKEVDRKNEEEAIRNNVRRMMKDILVARRKESTDIRISVEEIMKLVATIEEGMHKAFKDTSHRYKAKYRTLMFNLKDPRNKVLYRRVLSGDIPPEKLIWMTSDELATKELAEWREQETKHMIDMIKKEEESSNKARLIKKTHKGEVDVDGEDDFSTLESSTVEEEPKERKKIQKEETPEVALIDTTEEHRAHLFDLNCKICTGKMAPPGEVGGKSPASVVSSGPIQAAAESSIPSPPREVTLVEPPSPDSNDFSMTTSVAKVPSKHAEKSVWKGFVMMQNVAKFGTNAYLVSGSAEDLIHVLPDTLHVHGRIAHEQVWDYVFQCKTSSSREMCLIRFAAATDEEKMGYVSLYSYFHSRKRCGVIGNCYSGVKDMYLIPLASHQPVPPELLPFKGPGLQEPRPHMLLGLIIRTKQSTKRPRSITDRNPSASPRATDEPVAKRSNVSGADTSKASTAKSTTPTAKSTTPVLPDSPVDEIEDIVFHFHNSQTKLDAEPKSQQPSSAQPMPPVISTILQIQEQEKRLRALKEESERLGKDLAPKKPVVPENLSLPSLPPGVSSMLSRLVAPIQTSLTTTKADVSEDWNKIPGKAADTAGDEETPYDPEETPYDPEDLDLNLEEDKDTSAVQGRENSSTAAKLPDVASQLKSSTERGFLGAEPPLIPGLKILPASDARQVREDGARAAPRPNIVSQGRVETGRLEPRPFTVSPSGPDNEPVRPTTTASQARPDTGRFRSSSGVLQQDGPRAERTVLGSGADRSSGQDQYNRRNMDQSSGPFDGHSRSDVIQDPRRSRFRLPPAQDTSSYDRDFSETREFREMSRREADNWRLSRSRANERRWSDDNERRLVNDNGQRWANDSERRWEDENDRRWSNDRFRDRHDNYRRRDDRPWDDRPREERPREDRSWDDGPQKDRPPYDRPRDDRGRDDGPRDERPRDERPRDDLPRDDRPRDDRSRDDRPRDDRPRDGRPRDDRLREDRLRDDRTREDRPRDNRPRDDRPREDRPRDDRSRDDRQRGLSNRDRNYDRDRYSRDKWRR